MIHISSSLVLAASHVEAPDGRNPRIGWHNLVTAANVSADESSADEPVSNLGNPATYLSWRGTSTAQQSVVVALGAAEEINYFAIAKHNLGSSGASLKFQTSADGVIWDDVTADEQPGTDYALIHEFGAVFAGYCRLLITPGSEPPSIAVLHIGRTLVLQRRIYVGHTPLVYGRKTTVSTGRSESGQFLGRVLRRESYETSVDMQNITPAWYRANMEPFIEAARTGAYFWAWRPAQYPSEVGYAWLTNDVQVQNARPNGMMSFSFSMSGIR